MTPSGVSLILSPLETESLSSQRIATMYKVIDIQTKAIVKTYSEDKARVARAYANKLDLKYGAVRYIVKWEA